MQADAVIFPRWIIPIEPQNTVLENHAVVIHQGKILDILLQKEALVIYAPKEKIMLDQHAVLPGFINTHTHSPMTLFRGLADDLKLMDWLENHIWPAEKKWLSEEFCYDGTRLAVLEMLQSGTTCFNDNYFFLKGIGKAVQASGLRASLGGCVLDFPTAYADNVEEYLLKYEEIILQYQSHELIQIHLAPHAPYTVSDESFRKIKLFADKYNLLIQIHVQETQDEITYSLKQYHKTAVKRLYDLKILSEKTQAVHAVHLSEEDIHLFKKTGTHVVHCPVSNLKLASGFCPVGKLWDHHINTALGTDGAASNNSLDMLNELKTAAILAKAVSQNPCVLDAFQALKMATLNGAKAMGLSHQTGSLVKHKQADMIAIDLSYPNTQPVYHPVSQIVYAAQSTQISDVWVAGKRLVKNYINLNLDKTEILNKANDWKNKILNKNF